MPRLPSNPFEIGSNGVSKDQVDWNNYGYLTTDNGSGSGSNPFAQMKPGDGSVATTDPFAPPTSGVQKPGMGTVAGGGYGGSDGWGGGDIITGPPPFEPQQPPPTTYQPPPSQGGTDWANSLFNQNAQWGVQAYGNQRGWDALSSKGQWLGRLAPTLYNMYAVASANDPNLNALDYYNSLTPTLDNWWGVAQAANYAPMRRWR